MVSLLAAAFFGILRPVPDGPLQRHLTFVPLYCLASAAGGASSVAQARIRCLLAYFDHILHPLHGPRLREGAIAVQRCRAPRAAHDFWAAQSGVAVKAVEMSALRIEEHGGAAHVDFANRDLMVGEVLPSATQEEILFSVRPEMYCTVLFVDRLSAEEVVVFHGCRRFSDYSGYSGSFAYCPLLQCPIDAEGGSPATVLAMDAHMNNGASQFERDAVLTDLHKALTGFKAVPQSVVSTGLWGCGAFDGDPALKLVQQALAAAVAGVRLIFAVGFVADGLRNELAEVNRLITGRTVADVYAIVASENPVFVRPGACFQLLLHTLGGGPAPEPISAEEAEARRLVQEAAIDEANGLCMQSVEKLRRAFRLHPPLELQAPADL